MEDPYIGTLVDGKFRILNRIGKGGMGAVYRAEQEDMNRFVAVKILHAKYMGRSDLVARFRREARAMSQLSHPNTGNVFLYGQLQDDACYFVMEYLEGRNIAQTIRAKGPFEAERAVRIMIQVCGALEEAHRAGIVHRDLKPENIFLTERGGIEDFPKVLDFGLAKVTQRQMSAASLILTQDGMVFGTPEFMSPEQANGDTLDARSDIYSLGVILYEMLTGKLPFDAKAPMEYLKHHLDTPPIELNQRLPDRAFDPALSQVVMMTLQKRRSDRPQSAAELAQLLKESGTRSSLAPIPSAALRETSGRFKTVDAQLSSSPPTPLERMRPMAQSPAPQSQTPLPPQPRSFAPPPNSGSMSVLPWIVLAIGVLLAIGGVAAMVYALQL